LVSFVRKEEYGGTVHFSAYQPIEDAYAKEELHPGDIKAFITEAINLLLAPIQEEFRTNEAFQAADKAAYPPPPELEKKKVSKKHNIKPTAPNAEAEVEAAVENQASEQQEGTQIDMFPLKLALDA